MIASLLSFNPYITTILLIGFWSYIVRGISSCRYFILYGSVYVCGICYSHGVVINSYLFLVASRCRLASSCHCPVDTWLTVFSRSHSAKFDLSFRTHTQRQIPEVILMWYCRITDSQWYIHSYFALRLIIDQLFSVLLKSDKKRKTPLRAFVPDTSGFNCIMKPISYLYIRAYFIS